DRGRPGPRRRTRFPAPPGSVRRALFDTTAPAALTRSPTAPAVFPRAAAATTETPRRRSPHPAGRPPGHPPPAPYPRERHRTGLRPPPWTAPAHGPEAGATTSGRPPTTEQGRGSRS